MMNRIRNLLSRLPTLPAGRVRLALIAGLVVFGVVAVAGVTVVVLTSGDSAENYGAPIMQAPVVNERPAPEAGSEARSGDGVDSEPTAPATPSAPTPPVTPAPTPNDGSVPRIVTKVRPTDVNVVGSSTPGRTTYRFEDGYLVIESDVEQIDIEADGEEGDATDATVIGRFQGGPREVRIEGEAPSTLRYRSGDGFTVTTDGRNLSIR